MASITLNIRKILKFKKHSSVFMLPQTITLRQLVVQACERGVGAVLISDEKGKCVGIVTERDVMRCSGRGLDFDSVTAGEIMGKNLVMIGLDDDINHAMDIMINRNIRHLPVCSDKGLEGIVTIRDLIQAIRQSDKEEVEEFVRYLQQSVTAKTDGQAK